MHPYRYIKSLEFITHRLTRFFCCVLCFTAMSATVWGVNTGEPSLTAEGVTAYRAIAALAPDALIRNPDHLAHKFVSREYWHTAPFTLDYEKSKRFIDKYKISIYYYVNARTKHIDKLLERAAFDGTRQVVNLGAGFDSRAYRFAAQMPGMVFFELDLPATVDAKRERLLTFMESIPGQVKLLKINFNTQTLEQVLLAAGYEPSQKTLFIWEGVSYYISEAAVSGTLTFIASMSLPGSSVVFDYMPNAVIQKTYRNYPDARGPATRVAKMGEPWVFGISEGRAECYANRHGLQVLSILYPREMESRYLYRSDGALDGQVPSYFRIMHAVVPEPDVKHALSKKGCSPLVMVVSSTPATKQEKIASPAVSTEKTTTAKLTATSITGTWIGTDTMGGKLVFSFSNDYTFTCKRTGGRDSRLKTGTYSINGTEIEGKMDDIVFTATMTENALNGQWVQASVSISADFSLKNSSHLSLPVKPKP